MANLQDPSIFDHLPTGVVILNNNQNIVYCNEAFANILRTPLRRLKPGSPLSKSMPESSELLTTLSLESGQQRELTLHLPSGATPTVQVIRVTIAMNNENFHLLYVLDVTIEKQLHEKYKLVSKDSVTDEKTGLFNSRHLDSALQTAFQKSIPAAEKNLGLIIFDIDHFKQVNDTHGHLVGDIVLKNVSDILKSLAPTNSLTARYGGEEFCIMMPESTKDDLLNVCEKIRRKIESSAVQIPQEDQSVKVTVSSGAALRTHSIESARDLFEAADAALYEAKNSGRNRSVFKS